MTVDLTDPIFHDDDAARAHMESIRWPNGPFCPHCGAVEGITRLAGKSHRAGLHQCNACRGHFSVTNGSVMESSHVPLPKWVLAFHLMAASKKGISAHQLHRMIHVTYKTAWFMCHRIREAMAEPNAAPLGGEGKIVEADEAYHGKRETPAVRSRNAVKNPTKRGKGGGAEERPIVALVERGGKARAVHMNTVNGKNLRSFIVKNADRKSRLHTDESNLYPRLGKEFATHETVNHGAHEYARGDVTTNSVEGFFGIFKRGMIGVYQHCGENHLQRYLDEFTFRYNNRSKLGVEDTERAICAIKGAEGKRLTYRGPASAQNSQPTG
jgi:transposase-like protein